MRRDWWGVLCWAILAVVVAFVLANAGCATLPPPVVPPSGVYTCATACARGAALACTWAAPTSRGATCETVCENFELSGSMSYGVECVTRAPTCEAADSCGGPANP